MNYQALIPHFRRQRVLVAGELMLDVYLSGASNRLCREAPVPIVDVQQRQDMPGGSANAAMNLAALGAQTTFLTVTGDDHDADTAVSLLNHAGINTQTVIRQSDRQTIVKKRVSADGQLLVRYDYGSTDAVTPEAEASLIQHLERLHPQADAILLSDYGYGILTDNLITALERLQSRNRKHLVVDSKNLPRFHSLRPSMVKPNYAEAVNMLGLQKETNGRRVDQILAHGRDLLSLTGANVVAVTIDSAGAVIFERGKTPYRTYARPVPDSQAAGAGDTYASCFTLALALGLLPLEAAELAQAAAGVVVRRQGTAICTADDLIAWFDLPSKIISDHRELANHMRAYREQGRTVVFTNGCFDLLHRGHITYLRQARALGDILIVALNDDAGVRRLKGPERPINSLDDRMHVLAALDCVDHVVSFAEDSPEELIRVVRPDIFTKGGDYSKATLPEATLVEELGGSVVILPYMAEQSTTSVIAKIRSLDQAG